MGLMVAGQPAGVRWMRGVMAGRRVGPERIGSRSRDARGACDWSMLIVSCCVSNWIRLLDSVSEHDRLWIMRGYLDDVPEQLADQVRRLEPRLSPAAVVLLGIACVCRSDQLDPEWDRKVGEACDVFLSSFSENMNEERAECCLTVVAEVFRMLRKSERGKLGVGCWYPGDVPERIALYVKANEKEIESVWESFSDVKVKKLFMDCIDSIVDISYMADGVHLGRVVQLWRI